MTVPKAKRNKPDVRRKFTLSEKQLQKVKNDVTGEAVTKTAMLYIVALADRGWDEDKLCELFEDVSRYAQYVDDHIVKIRELQEIIERNTGVQIKWKW